MFEINIIEQTPYDETTEVYEGTDGKQYTSTYRIPEGVTYKTAQVKTGKIAYNNKDILTQNVETLDMNAIIKAINNIK